jgi:hypothetical protein
MLNYFIESKIMYGFETQTMGITVNGLRRNGESG